MSKWKQKQAIAHTDAVATIALKGAQTFKILHQLGIWHGKKRETQTKMQTKRED